ncbi:MULTISPECIES: copper resistance protein NlpE [unclassified Saccharibacter]|uniref:copper resistance protein NlpE n=1 Tax=unclassified Saccharibacter TaxID=2648722 RepID=UPI00132C45E6|nr:MULTISPECIES: copper resistance protein NlpE [unclassified Saccharibacter]MXV35689.1 hypothetical protein [Saccharibacter sp. EH611]MXV58303.1 hypothetical protein [Saccharibacter sp. EH70]MXV66400.1 hypothetical protein [Saccharibacter sp. EH60]
MSQQTLHNALSDDVLRAMLNEIADGYTLNTVCSGRDGRPTTGDFLRLMSDGGEKTRFFVEALDISCWVLADEIRALEAETDPLHAAANKARFEMLRFEIERRESVSHAIMTALENKK